MDVLALVVPDLWATVLAAGAAFMLWRGSCLRAMSVCILVLVATPGPR